MSDITDDDRDVRSWFDRFAEHNRDRRTRSLIGMMLLVLALAVVPTWLAVEHVRTIVILHDHGVTTSAKVLAIHGVRGPQTMTISPDDNPSALIRLSHWPRGTDVWDTLEITHDPANPGRVMAVDAPVVDADIAAAALFEIIALGLVALVVPPGLALLMRRVRDPAWRPRAEPETSTSHAPRQPRDRRPAWVPAAWRRIRREAQEQGAWTSILVFAVQVTVLGSEWESNRPDRLTVRVGAEEATITRWTGVPRYGDQIDVIYLPENPQVVRQAGLFPWGQSQFAFAAASIVGVITTPFLASAAIAGLLARAARARGRRSTGRCPTGQTPNLP
ncbi:hypothetical protein [Myceligenerans indicum]|uniref:DUF3592 domain-containing protein n=1 Tax=Myceligenerans indicum TaxID=2593663 RepID=A0ABS1LR81_9MICO|nr:hypothetical protein [Myceligenerans indicum]MBL0888734.1 hypothetical protein [Myceligenerans indicum]